MTPLTGLGMAVLVLAIAAVLLLPRRWAPLPLLLVTCYMVLGQGIMLGPFNFFTIRLVILAGLARILLRREGLGGGVGTIDRLMLLWAVWALVSSAFHRDPNATLTFNAGLVFNTCGMYFLLRTFCHSVEDIVRLSRLSLVLLLIVAVEMVVEKATASNLFAGLGGVPDTPNIREGSVRAQGPFAHAILAGTVGAVCLPLAVALWKSHRGTAIFGTAACVAMVFASASSGPLMSAIFAVLALLMWRFRDAMRAFRWMALAVYGLLAVVMEVPPYYLLGRIDLSGGSTGYHRARLIESSIEHLNEWWFAGTDYTRHWMATGVSWSPDHTDITNHYLMMGVLGGLPLMLLFMAILWKSFAIVGSAVRDPSATWQDKRFFFWALGASLFAHAATCISVSYFDQSFVFLYITLASVGSLGTLARNQAVASATSPSIGRGAGTPGHLPSRPVEKALRG